MYIDYTEYCLTDRQKEVMAAVIKHQSLTAAAEELGINVSNVHRCYKRVERQAEERHHAPDLGIDNPLPRSQRSAGISELVDERTGQTVLRWYKSKPAQRTAESLAEILETIKHKPAPKIPAPKQQQDADLLTLYTITDFHLGMYAWSEETGEDWDTEIAAKTMLTAINEMVRKSPASSTAILNIQGDFLHWDGLDAVTPTSGHVLDADTRFGKMIELSLDLIMWSVDALASKHDRVKLIVCEGNHDLAGSAWLQKSMKKIYRNNDRVEIDDTSFPYYAHLHGGTMLGFHHGHKMKNKSLPSLFASEPRYRKMWGQADYCYIHTGHYHQSEQDMSEFGGAIVERHPTLAARDSHCARGGYVSRRGARAIVYHTELGEVERVTVMPR